VVLQNLFSFQVGIEKTKGIEKRQWIEKKKRIERMLPSQMTQGLQW